MSGDIMKRKTYVDYLRIFAVFSIIIIHVSSAKWYSTDINSARWRAMNFYDSIARWGVPIFTMISGALFLNKNVTTKKLYSKYILRLFIAFIFWSLLYMIESCINLSGEVNFNLLNSITTTVKGHYHMWYILMIIGLYMCIPIFKVIVKDKKTTRYFLCLSFIFAFLIPWSIHLAQDLITKESILTIINSISGDINLMNLSMLSCYAFYFVFGYYLSNLDIKKKERIIIYIFGIVGFVSTIGLTLFITLNNNGALEFYYNDFAVNVFLEAYSLFVFFKYCKFRNEKINKYAEKISKYCFGIYLVHALIIAKFDSIFGINSMSFNTFISVPCIAVLVFIISYFISMIMNHIPIIKKYCV